MKFVEKSGHGAHDTNVGRCVRMCGAVQCTRWVHRKSDEISLFCLWNEFDKVFVVRYKSKSFKLRTVISINWMHKLLDTRAHTVVVCMVHGAWCVKHKTIKEKRNTQFERENVLLYRIRNSKYFMHGRFVSRNRTDAFNMYKMDETLLTLIYLYIHKAISFHQHVPLLCWKISSLLLIATR